MGAYTISDCGAWISFGNKGDLVVAVEGDHRRPNQYGVMPVNPAKHPNVKTGPGQQFIDWLISPEGQRTIARHKINGQQLFYPNANDPTASAERSARTGVAIANGLPWITFRSIQPRTLRWLETAGLLA